ncbi:MAG: SBBP repeat-containing protein, partial [Luteolibacter sp.]
MRAFISILFYLLVSSFLKADDFTAPAITITSHTNGTIVNTRTITLSGVASDSGRGDSGISSIYVRGTLPNTTAAGAGTVNWNQAVTLYPGSNSIDVYAYDNSPQKNQRLINIVINFQPLDTLGPLTQVTSHQNGQIVNTKSITLSGTSTDAGRGNNGISSVYVRGSIPNSNAAGAATVNWSREVTLSPGANYIEVGAYDNSDVQNYLSETLTINFQPVDPLPPTITISSHVNGQIVGTSTIVLSGTATDSGRGNNGVSNVYVRGNIAGATGVGSQIVNWSQQIQLQPGANYLSVYASDNSDVINQGQVDLIINFQPADTLAPTLNITSHTTGQTVFTSSITLQGTATDAGRGDRGISEVYVRGKIPNANTAGSGLVNWSQTVDLQPGSNYLQISASDVNEFPNVAYQNIVINFQPQDTLGPTILLTSHTDGQTLSSKSVTLSGTVTDAGRGDQGISQFYLQGKLPEVTAVGAAVVAWSKTVDLQEGNNYISILAYDNAPFPNQSSLNIVLKVVPNDTLSPTLQITSHTDQQVVSTNRILVAGTATDAGRGNHGISSVSVNFVRADNDTATISSVANWSRMITLNPGKNTIYVTATDNSLFPQSTNQSIVVYFDEGDQLAPQISIDSHTNNQVVATPTILLSGTASDSGLGGNGVAFVKVNGTAATGGVAVGSTTATWSRSVTLTPGANILSVVAEDTHGNSEAKTITLQYNPSDLLAPHVEITSHNNQQIVTTSPIIVSGIATDSGLGGNGISSVKINGVLIPGASSAGNASANWSGSMTLVPGPNVISVVATDSAQNNGAAAITLIYNPLDTTPPALEITSHQKNQVVLQNQITLAGTATDFNLGGSGITSVKVNGINAAGGSAAGGATSNWSQPLTLVLGDNIISVVATDGAGNSTAATTTIRYNPTDNLPPEIDVISHRNEQIVGTSQIVLGGTATDAGFGGHGVTEVAINGVTVTGATAVGNAQAIWSMPLQLALGANVISITARDSLNNLGAKTITLHYDPGYSQINSSFCWARNYGGRLLDSANGVAVDAQGNGYVVGSFQGTATFGSTTLVSAGGQDIFLAKLNAQGELLWVKQAGGTGDDVGYGVAVDTDGNALITGYYIQSATFGQTTISHTGGYDLFVAKYNSTGVLNWVRHPLAADNIYGRGIAVDATGNVAVVGSYYLSSTTSDVFVARISPDGNLLWVNGAGGSDDDQGSNVAVDSSGNIFITGFFTGEAYFSASETLYASESIEMFVAKYDVTGALVWADSSLSHEAQGSGIAVDATGNCFVTGYFREYADFGYQSLISDGFFDLFLTKYSPDGEVLWASNSGTNVAINAAGIALDAAGNIYLTGSYVGD